MTALKQTGYEKDTLGLWIAKDPEASLIYSMDWSEWLETGDAISTVSYALQVRSNDPEPLTKSSEGVQTGNMTYVRLAGGQVGKVYTVTAQVTTENGLVDRRAFRLKIENRQA